MDKVNFSIDLLNKVAVSTIFDVQKENTLCGLSIAHIWRKNSEESEFGQGFNLNLCERLKLDNDKMYYFDSFGDKYLLYNGVAKDMSYTKEVPESVSNLKAYQDIFNMPITAERTRMLPTQWLVNGTLTRGFNSDGYLIMINDTYEKLLQINFNENYKIIEIKDIVGGYEANKYSFNYNSDGYLILIQDDVQNSTVEYSYLNGFLATVSFSKNTIFSLSYTENELTKIESSEGYICKFEYSAALTVSVQSSLTEIPDGQSSTNLPATIFTRRIIFDKQKVLIEHEDSKRELYEISEKGYLLAYYKQEDDIVNFAERYDYIPRKKSVTYKAKRELLYKTSYLFFKFDYSEKYSYNEYGNLSEEIDSGTVIRNIKYTYENNALRRLRQMNVKIGTTFDFSVLPSYDVQGRYEGKSIAVNSTTIIGESIGYYFKNGRATMLPTSVFYSSSSVDILGSLKYEYDSSGNISHIENTTNNKNIYYTYDKLNRLIREDNEERDYSWYYNYDNSGNILSKEILSYTTGDYMHAMAAKIVYSYTDGKLTQYGKNGMSYDKLGNPTMYHGYLAKWEKGNQLVSYYNSDYAYDGFGRRIKKNNTVYLYDSCNRLIKSSDGMEYFYDHTGVMGFKYNKKLYFYQKDIQNNVIAIINDSGKLEYRYVYDAWGGHLVYDANGNQVATSTRKGWRPQPPTEIYDLNPFRYRSYFFDYETGLYYLKSRYYDPETGRFMNMDGVQNSVPTVINGMNLFAYCINNPIMYVDNLGTAREKIIDKRKKYRIDEKGTPGEHVHIEYDGKKYTWYKIGSGKRHSNELGYEDISNSMEKDLKKAGLDDDYFSFSYVSLPRWVEGYELSYSQPFQEILVFEQPNWSLERMQSDSVDAWQESFETKPVKPFRESFQISPEIVTGVLVAAAVIIFIGLAFLTGGVALIFI